MNLVELLKTKEYPGRFLIVGKIQNSIIAVYGVTARSASSKAKRYIFKPAEDLITVEATDPVVMSQGDLSLLQYNPAYFFENGIVIGNGRQTDTIKSLDRSTASEILSESLKDETYELDKYNTPRITGCIVKCSGDIRAALHIIRADEDNNVLRDLFEVPLENGKGKFISTYDGPNIRPTPSFKGGAIDVEVSADSLENLVNEIYEALSPKPGEEDVRVSIVGVSLSENVSEKKTFIINSVDREVS